MKKIITLSLMMWIIVFTGCGDGLDISPTGSVTEDSYWGRDSDAEIAVNAVYAEMDGRTMGLDNRTDIGYAQLGPLVASDGTVEGNWNRYYRGIRKANDVITNIDQIEIGDAELLERLEAEARFLRAYYYTQLTSLWGDVPLILEPIGINDHTAVTNREEVVDFVIEELDDIIDSEVLEISYSGDNVGRATHGAAQSLKARVALRNERWTIARDAAQAVMDSGVYELYPDYEELFHYEGQNSSEVIFDRQYTANGSNYDAFGLSASSIGGGSGIEPIHNLYLKYRLDDSAYDINSFDEPGEAYEDLDPRWAHTVFFTGQPIGDGDIYDSSPTSSTPDRVNRFETTTELGYNLKKYIDYENDIESPATGSINMIHIRYADVLLMYAEAKIQLDEIDQSVYDAINKVRERPTVELDPITSSTHSTAEELMDYLMDERAREFAFEGLRLFDVHRWKIGDEVAGPVLGAHFQRENGEIYLQSVGYTRTFNDYHHLWPIPQSEVNSNSSINDNNPGY
ncbi:MAG: RagB/SusD family nutrient uptake outer membrane protein [Balneolales bacterium]